MTTDSYGRWEAWIQNSRWVQGISAYAMAIAQYLGRFDALLIDGDRLADQQGAPIKDGEVDEARALADMDRHLVSYLWVLGVYELVRTVHEKFRKEEIGTPELHEDIQRVKKLLARVRIPLAKLQPANSHKGDYAVAQPAVQGWRGTSWEVAPGVFVARRDLSDEVLGLFTRITNSPIYAVPGPVSSSSTSV